MTWDSANQDGSGYGVYSQRFDASGAPQGSETRVNTTVAGDQLNSSVTALAGGGYLVTWQSYNQADGSYHIDSQRYDSSGAPQGGETQVDTIPLHQDSPAVTALPNGGYVIAWEAVVKDASPAGADLVIESQRYGPALGATEQVPLDLKGSLSVGDIDGGTGTETVTLSVGSGVLHVYDGASGTNVTGDGTGSVTITGTIAQLDALLGTDPSSIVTYIANSDTPPASTTLTLTIDDNGNSGSGGALTSTATLPISIAAVDDAPAITAPGAQSATEDLPISFSAAGGNALSVSDPDTSVLTITVSAAHGLLTLHGTSGLSFIIGDGTSDGTMTFSGTVAAIDAALDGLTYQGRQDYNGADTVTIAADDGTAPPVTAIVPVAIAAVNDPVHVTVPISLITLSPQEDVPILVSATGTALSISDADATVAPGGIYEVTLSAGHGTLSLGTLAGLAFTVGDGSADAAMTFHGTLADINAALATATYLGNADYNGPDQIQFGATDQYNNVVATGAGAATSASGIVKVTVFPVNDAPVVAAPTDASVSYSENGTAVALLQGSTITDADSPANFSTGSLTLTVTGAADGEINLIAGKGFTVSGGTLFYNGNAIGTIGGFGTDTISLYGMTTAATPAVVSALAGAFSFDVPGDDPDPTDRTVTLTFYDGGNSGTGGDLSGTTTQVVHVVQVNDAPVAGVPGAQAGTEDTNLVFGTAGGNAISVSDVDSEGAAETVTLGVLHGTLTLGSESGVAVTNDGTGSVQLTGTIAAIDAALNGLIYRGNLNYNGSDTLTVTVDDGGHSGTGGALSSQKTVAITLAADGFTDIAPGGPAPVGTSGSDTFRFAPGGTYDVSGLGGNDLFYFGGGGMTSADKVDGGPGADQIALQGDYWTIPLTLGAGVVNIESIYLMPGSDTRGGDTAGNHYSYDIVANDANDAAGHQLTIDGSQLRPGENFTFDGSAETNGFLYIYAGQGIDTLTGGHGNDVFLFNAGTFGASDRVDGGPGADQLALRGDDTITFGANQLVGIESIYLVSAHDRRLAGGGTDFTYDVTMNDGNVAAGKTLVVDGSALHATEKMTFNAGAETDGAYVVYGGAGSDTIAGGHGNDTIVGDGGGDTLFGGAGNDTFLYRTLSDSAPGKSDSIGDFASGDIINLAPLDADTTKAGDQAFTFIGANAFDHHAGELQAIDKGSGNWTISADVNGDGVADFQIMVHVADGHTITAGDFHL